MPDLSHFHLKYYYPSNSSASSITIDRTQKLIEHPFHYKYLPRARTFRFPFLNREFAYIDRSPNPLLGYFIKINPFLDGNSLSYKLSHRALHYNDIKDKTAMIDYAKAGSISPTAPNIINPAYKELKYYDHITGPLQERTWRGIVESSHSLYNSAPITNGELKGVYFDSQPEILYDVDKFKLNRFNLCFLSIDQYAYLMNNIMNRGSRDGLLLISGCRIEPKEIKTLSGNNVDPKFNSGEGYFTLKFEAIVADPEIGFEGSAEQLSERGTPSPIITLANPCPPIWNPTFYPESVHHLISREEMYRSLDLAYRIIILGDETADIPG